MATVDYCAFSQIRISDTFMCTSIEQVSVRVMIHLGRYPCAPSYCVYLNIIRWELVPVMETSHTPLFPNIRASGQLEGSMY